MSISLIVEDGSIVTGANSYIDLASLQLFAEYRGETLSLDDEVNKSCIIKAMDYIETLKFKGVAVSETQPLKFPRSLVYINGVERPSDEIHQLLKNAVCSYAIAILNGNYPQETYRKSELLKSKKIGPIEKEYFDVTMTGVGVVNAQAEGFLKPLLSGNNDSYNLVAVRV